MEPYVRFVTNSHGITTDNDHPVQSRFVAGVRGITDRFAWRHWFR